MSTKRGQLQTVSEMGRAALWWADRFRSPVLPLWPAVNGVCACPKGRGCQHSGKHQIGMLAPRGAHSATREDFRILDWWTRYPIASIGLATGHPLPGGGYLITLDVDPRSDGDHSLDELENEHGPLSSTLTVRTGGGGWHYYLRTFERPARSPDLAPGVEIKGPGRYVVAPPSVHASGEVYTIETLVRPAPAPEWITEALRPPVRPIRSDGTAYTSDLETIRSALMAIPTRPDYPEWIRIIAAVLDAVGGDHHEAEALLIEWSPEERPREYARKLASPLERITAGTLFYLARSNGWTDPAVRQGGEIAARLLRKAVAA